MNWSDIWKQKAEKHKSGSFSLEDILCTNGYDVKYARTGVDSIRKYVSDLIPKLKLSKADSLLEVGSGAGAIAFPMIENGINVTGIDPCSELIDIAKLAMPEHDFFVNEACSFDLKNKNFDAVLSHGVFQFFESEKYGLDAFLNMLNHTRRGGIVAITDLLDAENKDSLIQERIRILGEKEYKKKYVDTKLTHQFYNKEKFIEVSQGLCEKVWVEKQFLDNATASYKYNIFAIK